MLDTNKFKKQYVSYYKVSKSDLPFCCPPEGKKNDINHPKVFLNFDDKNQMACEYCGTDYVLEDDK